MDTVEGGLEECKSVRVAVLGSARIAQTLKLLLWDNGDWDQCGARADRGGVERFES